MSMIGFGSPVPRVLPNPDGAFATADRPQLLFLYAGLSLASLAFVPIYEADVAIRLTATHDLSLRLTATADVSIEG